MKYGLNRVKGYMKKLTLGVPTTLHKVLNSENVPDCKNAFLRERVKSTQPSRFRQNIVELGKYPVCTLYRKISDHFYLYFDYLISSMVNMYLHEYWSFCH